MTDENQSPNPTGNPTVAPKVKVGQPVNRYRRRSNQGADADTTTQRSTRFVGSTGGLEGHIFFHGEGMDVGCLTPKGQLLGYVGGGYSASEAAPLGLGQVTLIGIKHPGESKSKTDIEKKEYWQQEQWELDMGRYQERMGKLLQDLTSCYATTWGQCSNNLRNKIKADSSYKITNEERDAIKLFQLILVICNKSTEIDHA